MNVADKDKALKARKCSIVSDRGDYALVYPFGPDGQNRAHDLAAQSRDAAINEAWDWLHPEYYALERIKVIQDVVASDYGTTVEALVNGGRPEPLATARRVAMVLCRELTQATLVHIGLVFGGRDHGTVIHAERSVRSQYDTDEPFAARFNTLRHLCAASLSKARIKGTPSL